MNKTDDESAPGSAAESVSPRDMANAIRFLSMDAVQAANSGHPGMPMGMADVATVLFGKFLKFDPEWPGWPDRDRFVLSAGHGSMLLYSLLYLTGYTGSNLENIRNFRQLQSACAGHPEYWELPGIETTTGPLGQGLGNAVGMALAECLMAARFGDDVVDHHTYALAGDGCLMEGISHEAISLAGHLRLGKLIVLFDDNRISIDGSTELATSDDTIKRFQAAGWHTDTVDGHDPEAIERALAGAKTEDRPSLIACRTVIGYGAPNKQGSESTHGAALGEEEVAAARENLDWPHAAFEIPGPILEAWRAVGARGKKTAAEWRERLEKLDKKTKDEFERRIGGGLPEDFGAVIDSVKRAFSESGEKLATRKASGKVLEAINEALPETVGGSADLTGSNNTKTPNIDVVTAGRFDGRYIHYGVREHGMAAAMNGIALHGGLIPYGGTFLVFSDYCRPSIRLSALMGQRVIYVMTHDSIGLGEDGPTHQPIEHLPALRAMPGLRVFRPADPVETAECWDLALRTGGPSVIALTRQGVPLLRAKHDKDNRCATGAYELIPADGTAQVSLIATGSEVGVAAAAREMLAEDGIAARVISMPCAEIFDEQDSGYRAGLLDDDSFKVGIEAAAGLGWERYIGRDGLFIGMDSFGKSAPAGDLFAHFGITAEAVAQKVRDRL